MRIITHHQCRLFFGEKTTHDVIGADVDWTELAEETPEESGEDDETTGVVGGGEGREGGATGVVVEGEGKANGMMVGDCDSDVLLPLGVTTEVFVGTPPSLGGGWGGCRRPRFTLFNCGVCPDTRGLRNVQNESAQRTRNEWARLVAHKPMLRVFRKKKKGSGEPRLERLYPSKLRSW